MSVSRYRLLGVGSRRNSVAKLSSLLDAYRAPPLSLDRTRVQQDVLGWVLPPGTDTFEGVEEFTPSSDLHWDMSHCQIDDGYLLRLRTEKRQVPSQLLQLVLRERFAQWAQKTGQLPGPKDRRDIKEAVQKDLAKRALPSIGHIDGFWRDIPGELIIFATSKKACQLFTQTFSDTFANHLGQTLVSITPPLMALETPAWRDTAIAVERLNTLLSTTPSAFLTPS